MSHVEKPAHKVHPTNDAYRKNWERIFTSKWSKDIDRVIDDVQNKKTEWQKLQKKLGHRRTNYNPI